MVSRPCLLKARPSASHSVITSVKSRVNKEIVYRTQSDGIDLPIAMLVNGYSASASELLSGALKDNGVAELFGTVTYGKGIVQTFFDINYGRDGSIKFTTPSIICCSGAKMILISSITAGKY